MMSPQNSEIGGSDDKYVLGGFHSQKPEGNPCFLLRVPKESVPFSINALRSSGEVYKLSRTTLYPWLYRPSIKDKTTLEGPV